MKKILVPIDFSDFSAKAVKLADKLAQRVSGEVHLVHIVSTPTQMDEYGYEVTLSEEQEAIARMKEFVLIHQLKPANTFVRLGSLTKDMNHYISANQIDLVLMASRGSEGLREVFIGSNAERIVRYATCPVLIVKQELDELILRNIAFAGSFEKDIPRSVQPLKELIELFTPALHLVEVLEPERMWLENEVHNEMGRFALENSFSNVQVHVIKNSSIVKGLEEFMSHNYIDLLVMPTHQYQGIRRLLHSSVAEHVVNRLGDTMLTFHLGSSEEE